MFDEAPGTVKLSSTSGSFALGLPAGAAYQLDWSTVSGDCDASGYQAPEGRGAKKIKLTADTVSGGLNDLYEMNCIAAKCPTGFFAAHRF